MLFSLLKYGKQNERCRAQSTIHVLGMMVHMGILYQLSYRFTDITRHMSLSLTILHSYTMLNLYGQFLLVIAVLQPLFVQSQYYLLSRCISVIFDKAFHDGHDYQTYQKSEGEHCDCNDMCKTVTTGFVTMTFIVYLQGKKR